MTEIASKDLQIGKYAQMAAEFSRDALLVTDADDRVLWLNRGFEEMSGYNLADLIGRNPDEKLRGPLTGDDAMEKIREGLRQREPCDIEILYYGKDGSPFWMETRITPIFDEDGNHTHYMSSSRDITTRRELQRKTEEAAESEMKRQRERKILSQVSEWLYSAKSLDELLKVVSRSLEILIPEASGRLFVYSNSRDALDQLVKWGNADDVTHIDPDDCWALRRGRAYSYGTRAIEFPCQHVSEDQHPYFCLPIIAHGQTNGLLHLCFDRMEDVFGNEEDRKAGLDQKWQLALLCAEQISLAIANVQLRQELLDQSVRDPLTNLWNRRWFLEAAHRELKRSNQTKLPLTMISMDVDHFKKFNDHHGHDAGDVVLRAMGTAMLDFFNTNLEPCRIGGEEFVVLCPGLHVDEAAELAEEFRKKVSKIDINYAGSALPKITVSTGIASSPDHGNQVVDLLKHADDAMYQAKANGRDQVVVYLDRSRRRARMVDI